MPLFRAGFAFSIAAVVCVASAIGCAPPPAAAPSAAASPVTSSANAAATRAAPQKPTPSPALLALAKRDETLSIVNPATLEVIARIPVGHDPHEVVASPDGKLAYVTNYGGGRFNSIAVVDLVAQTALPAIDLGALRGPHGLAYAGGKVWFTAEGAKVIGSYDPAKNVVDWALGTGQDRTHMIVVAPDLEHIVTTNVSSGTVSFLEKVTLPKPDGLPPGAGPMPRPGPGGPGGPGGGPRTDWEQTLVTVGAGTEGFDISPSRTEIWAADSQDGFISIVDVASKRLVQRFDAKVAGANRLKFTPDGKWVLVSSLRSGDLAVFDAKTHAESKRIPLGGRGASGILVQPDSARAYVACSPDGFVSVIDLRTMTVVGKVVPGTEPDGLAWALAPGR